MHMLPDLSQLRLSEPPAPVDGTLRDGNGEWSNEWDVVQIGAHRIHRCANAVPDGGVFKHVNPSVGLSLAGPKGLGVFAIEPLLEGDLVCLFTGVWAYESDVDKSLEGGGLVFNNPCVTNYATRWARVLPNEDVDDMLARKPKQPMPAPKLKPHRINPGQSVEGSRQGKEGKALELKRFDRLIVLPRMSAQALPGGLNRSGKLCNLQYSRAANAPLVDVGAMLNHSSKNFNCKTKKALLRLAGDAIDGPEHPVLVVVAERDVSAGDELTIDYGYDPAKSEEERKGEAFKPTRYTGGKKRGLGGSGNDGGDEGFLFTIQARGILRRDGDKAVASMKGWSKPRLPTEEACGPAVTFWPTTKSYNGDTRTMADDDPRACVVNVPRAQLFDDLYRRVLRADEPPLAPPLAPAPALPAPAPLPPAADSSDAGPSNSPADDDDGDDDALVDLCRLSDDELWRYWLEPF